MPTRSEVLGNRTIRGEKPLCLSWGLEPLHAPLPLARGLMGVFRTVIEIEEFRTLKLRGKGFVVTGESAQLRQAVGRARRNCPEAKGLPNL